jgi:hypothetical protein
MFPDTTHLLMWNVLCKKGTGLNMAHWWAKRACCSGMGGNCWGGCSHPLWHTPLLAERWGSQVWLLTRRMERGRHGKTGAQRWGACPGVRLDFPLGWRTGSHINDKYTHYLQLLQEPGRSQGENVFWGTECNEFLFPYCIFLRYKGKMSSNHAIWIN